MKLRYFVSCFCLLTNSLFSATWNLNANGNWNVNANWTAPAIFPNGVDAVANFGTVITANRIVTLGTNITVGTITIGSNSGYTIASGSGETLTFQATTPTATLTKGAGSHTISAPLILNTTLNISNTTPNVTNLDLNGSISGPGGLMLTSMNAASRLNLNATNTYLGPTVFNSGNVRYQADGAIPAGSNVTLGQNAGVPGSLAFFLASPGMSPANAFFLTINMTGSVSTLTNRAIYLLSLSGTGSITLDAGGAASSILSINGSTSTTYSGTISGGLLSTSTNPGSQNRVYKDGTSTLTLTGNSTYISRTFIANGIIDINNASALGAATNAGGSPVFVMSDGTSGTLSLNNNINLQKSLFLNGPGFGSGGALANTSGANTVSQPVTIGWAGGTQTAMDATVAVNGTSLTFSNVVQGSNNLIKTGLSPLIYTGNLPNTLTGTTIINAGTLQLNKTAGVNALAGNAQINPTATLLLNAPNQIIDTADVQIAGGTFNMNGNNETIGSLTFLSGTLTQAGALLTLANNAAATTPALTMRDTTITGNIAIPNGGTVVFDATNNGTARIEGNVDLGGMVSDFNIADGTATPDMIVSGPITNGNITKSGPGWLQLTGANSFIGATVINAGTLEGNTTSLPNDIVDNANLVFTQNFDGTYASSISGSGTMLKRGSGSLTFTNNNTLGGLTTIAEGTFIVNGSFGGSGGLVTEVGTTLRGIGTISKNSIINGTLNPGLSTSDIGTLNFVGNQTMTGTSNLIIDINPTTSDRVNVTGTFNILPGATLNLVPVPGNYANFLSYDIVHTTAGVSGRFSNVTSTLPLFNALVVYTPTDILIQGFFSPFSSLFSRGNAGAVARCLDSLSSLPNSDLANVILALRTLTSEATLKKALLQLQPSAFSSLALAQENNTLYIRNTILERLNEALHSCSECYEGTNFWVAPICEYSIQNNIYLHKALDKEPGYEATTPGFFAGVDRSFSNCSYLGGGVGYTFTDLKWKQNRGSANINSVYAALYGRIERNSRYLQGTLLGAYNHYNVDRRIHFADLRRKASSNHDGVEGSAEVEAGLIMTVSEFLVSPFINVNYMYVNEEKFKEHGANSLNLRIKEKDSDLLTSEFGIDISRCIVYGTPFLQLSVIRESRFRGGTEEGSFAIGDCTMKVHGINPSRTLGAVTAGIASFINENYSLSAYYRGKYGNNFQSHSLTLEARF